MNCCNFKLLFDDKRYTSVMMIAWMIFACCVFYVLGAFHTHYMTFGPSATTEFMGLKIDTWYKWHWLAQFSFWNTAINEFLGASLFPFFTNTIQVIFTNTIPYRN